TMNVKDGYAIKTALDKGYNICIISGGSNPGVRTRLNGLGVTDIHLGVGDKIETLDEYLDIYNIKPEQALYMGDDIPDYHVMNRVGMPCGPDVAVDEIREISKCIAHRQVG